MMKLVDMLGLDSSDENLVGSSPAIRKSYFLSLVNTTFFRLKFMFKILKLKEESSIKVFNRFD